MSILIAIDPGHGMDTNGKRTPVFPNGTFMKEREFNKAVAIYLKPLLEKNNFSVLNVAESDTDVPLATRSALANNTIQNKFNRPVDFYLSIHANAYGDGITFNSANGIRTYIYKNAAKGSKSEIYAGILQKKLVLATGLKDGGVLLEDYHVVRETKMPAVLVECGFMTNFKEAELLRSDAYRRTCAEALAKGVCDIFCAGFEYSDVQTGTPIIGKATATVGQAKAWAMKKNAAPFFIALADTFWTLSQYIGIDPAVAYTQSAKETGYGNFKGVLNATYNNPCGMKTTEGGGDYDANAHMRFDSWEQGIQAQIDHLALYAGAFGYPKANTPDPRHFPYLHGKCKYVEDLGGCWAPSNTYGVEIVKMIDELKKTPVTQSVDEAKDPALEMKEVIVSNAEKETPVWQTQGLQTLVDAKIIVSPEYWQNSMQQNITVGEVLGILGRIVANM